MTTPPERIEEIVQNIQKHSYHAHCWDDVGLRKLLKQAFHSELDQPTQKSHQEIEVDYLLKQHPL